MPDSPSLSRVLDLTEKLRREDREFCVVTVVRTADLTSAKAGAKAVVTADGEMHGFIGGACVSGAASRAALSALKSGKARMIRVKPKERARTRADADGVELHPSSCPSGGAADLFVEPMRRAPRLVICGESPAAAALCVLGRTVGFRVILASVGKGREASSSSSSSAALAESGRDGFGPDQRVSGFDLSGLDLDSRDAAVVATQGRRDGAALAGALSTAAGYVGMIGSRRKMAALRGKLAGDFSPERLSSLRAPAGLDIGGVGPEEIALSILAEIIRDRRAPGEKAAPK